jgi:hypothetical protein
MDEKGLIEVAWRPLASAVLVQEKLANPYPRLRNFFLRRRTQGALQVRQLGLLRGAGVCE